MEFHEWQLMVVGVIASVIARGLQIYAAKKGQPLGTVVTQWVIYVISLPLAIWFGGFAFPALPVFTGEPSAILQELARFVGELAVGVGLLIGNATLVYQALKKYVYEKIGLFRLPE